jgi:mRNA-degrading endonuclease RelE of RelBE toxin-antitoxin system
VSPITIEWDETAERSLEQLNLIQRRQVKRAVERLASFSLTDVFRHTNVRQLKGETPPQWRLRVGGLRVIFIRTAAGIRIRRVALRSDAYR